MVFNPSIAPTRTRGSRGGRAQKDGPRGVLEPPAAVPSSVVVVVVMVVMVVVPVSSHPPPR